MRHIYPFGRLRCQFCDNTSTGTGRMVETGSLGSAFLTYAWCGGCGRERCWDCGAIGMELTAPIRDDRKYRICEDCL